MIGGEGSNRRGVTVPVPQNAATALPLAHLPWAFFPRSGGGERRCLLSGTALSFFYCSTPPQPAHIITSVPSTYRSCWLADKEGAKEQERESREKEKEKQAQSFRRLHMPEPKVCQTTLEPPGDNAFSPEPKTT